MSNNNYDVVILDESSIEQQVDLFKQAFSLEENKDFLIKFWRKKHYLNPIGKSLIFGVFVHDKLIGMNAFIPSTYKYQGNVVKCLQSCESGVMPDYQGAGVWRTIVQYAVKYIFSKTDFKLIFGFPNYRNSYKGFVKMGWQTVDYMYNYILVVNPRKFSEIFIKNSFLSLFSFPLLLQKIPFNFFKSSTIDIEECKPEELIWNNNADTISVTPSVEYIKWKIEYRNQKIIALKKKGEIIATCIYILDQFKGQKVVRLDCINIKPGIKFPLKVILSNILIYISKFHSDVAFIRTWATKRSQFSKECEKLCFFKSTHPNPFILKYNKDEAFKSHWELSFYDLD